MPVKRSRKSIKHTNLTILAIRTSKDSGEVKAQEKLEINANLEISDKKEVNDNAKNQEVNSESKKVEASSSEPVIKQLHQDPKDSPNTSIPSKPPVKSLGRGPASRPSIKSVLRPPATKQVTPSPVKPTVEPKVGQNVSIGGGRKGIIRFVGPLGGMNNLISY